MADPPGTIRHIADLQAEMSRSAFKRQVVTGQACRAEDRTCDAGCESGAVHCVMRHKELHERTHDPDHCDRVWAGA